MLSRWRCFHRKYPRSPRSEPAIHRYAESRQTPDSGRASTGDHCSTQSLWKASVRPRYPVPWLHASAELRNAQDSFQSDPTSLPAWRHSSGDYEPSLSYRKMGVLSSTEEPFWDSFRLYEYVLRGQGANTAPRPLSLCWRLQPSTCLSVGKKHIFKMTID